MPKFWRRGVSKLRFLPAVADKAAVTRPEITAGTDLSIVLADMNGWEFTNNAIPIPNLAETFTGSLPGEDTVADSSLTIYDDDTTATIRALLAKGTNGFMFWAPYGDVAAKRYECFPIRVANITDEKSLGNDPARFVVNCAITSEPEIDGSIPV